MFTIYIEATVVASFRALNDAQTIRHYLIGFHGLRATPSKVFILPT